MSTDNTWRAVDGNGKTVLTLDADGFAHTPGKLTFFNQREATVNVSTADPIVVLADDGRVLLRIKSDGTVDGAIEDATEAAGIFVREVRKIVQRYTADGVA